MILAYLPAFAAFGGSAFGGLTTFAATLFTQRRKDSTAGVTRRRADDRNCIIRILPIKACRLTSAEISELSCTSVDTYFAPNKTFPELRELMASPATDPLKEFSLTCRKELSALGRS